MVHGRKVAKNRCTVFMFLQKWFTNTNLDIKIFVLIIYQKIAFSFQ